MKKPIRSIKQLLNQRGVTALIVAVMMVVFLGLAALAVDVGFTLVTRNELQNVGDAASLAATRKLGSIYEPMPYAQQQLYVCGGADLASIISFAQEVAFKNEAAGKNITVNGADVIIGQWKKDPADNKMKLFETLNQPDAVRVIARRDSSAMSLEGPITTFFAKIFGINTLDVRAGATAALTGQSTAGPGGLPVPLGISRAWFDRQPDFNFCNQPIRFYPTNDPTSCAGWHVYNRYSNAPDSRLRRTIGDLESGSYQSPETTAGQTQFEFTNGTMSTQTFAAMKSLFDSRKVLNDGIIDNDTDPNTWTTSVPIYNLDDCGSMAGAQLIVGFATIVITGVQDAPVHQIDGYVICNDVEPGRGGGGEYGTKGSIPGLVE